MIQKYSICNRVRHVISQKSGVTYVFSHYARIKVDSYDSLPIEKMLILHILHNVIALINPNLGRLFRGSFWGGGGGMPPPPCLKLVRDMLEAWNLSRKYKFICSFRKYKFWYQGLLSFADVSIFLQKTSVFWPK